MTQQSLPEGFTPGDRDVVIGKGKKFYFHGGNQWLREVVEGRTEEYSRANNKTEKSVILSSVVEYIRANGRFVRLDKDGSWVVAEQLLCREKCSAVFREKLRQASSSSSPNVRKAQLDVSQELIQRLVAANISSSTSKDNLRKYAMSMSTGNLNMLKPSRSSGHFAQAKKQRSFRGIKNATWGESKTATSSTSNAFQNLFPLNPTPLQVPSQVGSTSPCNAKQVQQMMGSSQLQPIFQAPALTASTDTSDLKPLETKVEDFRLKALKQLDAQLSNLVDARAQNQELNQGQDQEGGNDLEDLLNMPIMDLNPDDVDQFGMDVNNMHSFPDQQHSQPFAA